MKDYSELKALAEKAADGPWCSDYCYSAIRHVDRNCDIECGTHPEREGCNSFGRYDGPYVAAASPDVILALIAEVEQARKDRPAAKL